MLTADLESRFASELLSTILKLSSFAKSADNALKSLSVNAKLPVKEF